MNPRAPDPSTPISVPRHDPYRGVVLVLLVLIALAAKGVLDPLTGALFQSVAVLIVVANSARILRFSRPAPLETSRAADSGTQIAPPPAY